MGLSAFRPRYGLFLRLSHWVTFLLVLLAYVSVNLHHRFPRGAPERVLAPDEIAVEILQLCDGQRSVADIVDLLAVKYNAPRTDIGTDVIAMLQDLADKGFLTQAREKTS